CTQLDRCPSDKRRPAACAAGPFIRHWVQLTAKREVRSPTLAVMAMLVPPFRLQVVPPQTPLQAALWACAGSLGLVFAYHCSYNLVLFACSIYLLQIYDRVLSSRSADTLLMLTLIVALTVVVGGVLDALRRAILGRLGVWLEDRLRPTVLSVCL